VIPDNLRSLATVMGSSLLLQAGGVLDAGTAETDD
jgi:hypothetical protein